MNPNQFKRGSFAYNDIFDARRVTDLENRARNLNTPFAERNRLLSEADKIRSGIRNLTSSERDPFKSLQEQLDAAKETAKATTELNKKIGGTH